MLSKIQNKNINFTSTPIREVMLPKVKDGKIIGECKTILTKMDIFDNEDIETVSMIKEKWARKTLFAKHFGDNFSAKSSDHSNYYAIELPRQAQLKQEPLCVIKTNLQISPHGNRIIHLNYLITNPEFKHGEKSALKNIGEAMMGEVFNLAKKVRASMLTFQSANDGFYYKIFKKTTVKLMNEPFYSEFESNIFNIKSTEFDKYLDHCKKAFKIDFSQNLSSKPEI